MYRLMNVADKTNHATLRLGSILLLQVNKTNPSVVAGRVITAG